MSQALQRAVRDYFDGHGRASDTVAMPLSGIGLMRSYEPTGIVKSIYKPVVCLILQGAKQVTVGRETYLFEAGRSALVRADLPVLSRITRASRTAPYLALAIELDMTVLLDLAPRVGGQSGTEPGVPAVLLDDTDAAVANCALRLLGLLDRPGAIPLLHPAILRELHYWLLTGRHGQAVGALGLPNAAAQRIARAVAVLRGEFDRHLRVDRLAAVAGMSPSSFHTHFREITSLSPIQFQKQLRLIEARRRMLDDAAPPSRAALEVGYESVTQFTREYARMFGLPPGRDMRECRAS